MDTVGPSLIPRLEGRARGAGRQPAPKRFRPSDAELKLSNYTLVHVCKSCHIVSRLFFLYLMFECTWHRLNHLSPDCASTFAAQGHSPASACASFKIHTHGRASTASRGALRPGHDWTDDPGTRDMRPGPGHCPIANSRNPGGPVTQSSTLESRAHPTNDKQMSSPPRLTGWAGYCCTAIHPPNPPFVACPSLTYRCHWSKIPLSWLQGSGYRGAGKHLGYRTALSSWPRTNGARDTDTRVGGEEENEQRKEREKRGP